MMLVMNALINCGHHTAKNEPHALFGFAMKSVDKNMARPFARVKI